MSWHRIIVVWLWGVGWLSVSIVGRGVCVGGVGMGIIGMGARVWEEGQCCVSRGRRGRGRISVLGAVGSLGMLGGRMGVGFGVWCIGMLR